MKERIAEKVALIKSQRQPYRTSWGFLIRPQYTDAFQKVRHIVKDDQPKVTGLSRYKEFIRWYKRSKPLGIKIYRKAWCADGATFWAIAYSGTYYITISQEETLAGYIATLHFRNQAKDSYPIAVTYIKLKNFFMKNAILSKLPSLQWKMTDDMMQLMIPV